LGPFLLKGLLGFLRKVWVFSRKLFHERFYATERLGWVPFTPGVSWGT